LNDAHERLGTMAIDNTSGGLQAINTSTINPSVNNILIAIIILLVGFIAARLLTNLVHWLLGEMNLNKAISRKLQNKIDLEGWIVRVLSIVVYCTTIILALSTVGLTRYVIQYLIYILLFIILLTMLLSLENSANNLIAGIIVRRRYHLHAGNYIFTKNVEGTINKVHWLSVEIDKREEKIYIPYALLLKETVRIKKYT
jgi:hypothetical protein